MNLFWHLIKLSFKQQLAYRMALWAGLATNLFFGVLRAVLLIALYGQRGEVNGLTVQGAVTYVGLTQSMIAFMSLFGGLELTDAIYSGAIASDLLRPVSIFTFWMARDFGRSLVNLLGRGVLFMLLYGLFFPISLPQNLATWLLLCVSFLMAWLLNYSWRYLISLAAFWTPDARGFLRITGTVFQLLSGFIMPLALLPDWFVSLANLTPFPSVVNTSIEIYLGTFQGSQVWNALFTQVIWLLLLIAVGEVVFRAGIRRLVIQGG